MLSNFFLLEGLLTNCIWTTIWVIKIAGSYILFQHFVDIANLYLKIEQCRWEVGGQPDVFPLIGNLPFVAWILPKLFETL